VSRCEKYLDSQRGFDVTSTLFDAIPAQYRRGIDVISTGWRVASTTRDFLDTGISRDRVYGVGVMNTSLRRESTAE
jgi:hypothetical protein